MQQTWRDRLEQLLKETPDLSMKRLSLKAGMSESGIRDVLHRGRSPSVDTFVAIADALGVEPGYLLTGGDGRSLKLPLVGSLNGAGETWDPIAGLTIEVEGLSAQEPDTIVLEVRGDELSPVYRDKDLLICPRRGGRYAQNLLGLDCAVQTSNSERYVKILKKGARHGLFNLKSLRPLVDDIENVALEWVAPITWIKRRGR